MGCYAAQIDSYRRFGRKYDPNLQVLSSNSSWNAWALKTGPIGSPETLTINY